MEKRGRSACGPKTDLGSSMKKRSMKAKAVLAIVAGVVLSTCCALALPAHIAHATSVDELQAKVDEAATAYDEATAKVNELKAKIDESQAKIDEVTALLPEQRDRAAMSMSSIYKMQQDTPGLVSLLLSAKDFSDFLTTYQYISAIQRSNSDDLNELVSTENELASAQQALAAAKEEADNQQHQAQEAMNQAQTALNQLNAQISAQAAAEAAARENANTQQNQTPETASSSNSSNTSNDNSNAGTDTGKSDPGATDGSEVETDGEWMIGYASAYSVADNTGGNSTASGDILTDDSMTVAVPLSQSCLLGRNVQIRYGGRTITATVNDVGGFAQYGRVLDLAGGCWKAFGCSSSHEWGVRAVQYRFL